MAEAVTVEKTSWTGPDRPDFEKSVGKRSVLVVFLVLWGYTVYRLGTLWHSNSDYAYGWFVPVLCLCLAWER